MPDYTLGLFANMYPAFEGDYRGIFIGQMVRDLESHGVTVEKAVKTSQSVFGYAPFLYHSILLSRNRTPDLFQAEYIPHSSLVPAYLGRRKVPLILKFHGDDARIFPFQNSFFMSITRAMIQRSDYVLTASEEIRSTLISLGAVPEKISALHTGVDTTFFSPRNQKITRQELGVPVDAMVFLFVGRLHAWKGLNEILAVAKRCPDEKFVFVGPGTIPDHPKNCLFTGSQKPESVRAWYNAADCLLLPTYTEAVPTSVMESSACEIPAIVTNIGGCPEIVEHGKNGLIIPVRDIPALYDAVIWMRDHPDERKWMGKQARVIVKEHYDHTVQVKKLIEIHMRVISRK